VKFSLNSTTFLIYFISKTRKWRRAKLQPESLLGAVAVVVAGVAEEEEEEETTIMLLPKREAVAAVEDEEVEAAKSRHQ
jgi:hypothetical protein